MAERKEDPVSERLAKIESDIASLKNDVAWLKQLYKSLDYRVWFILGGVIVTILVSLLR
ncbi:MAG: hypothetical protein AOA65_0044 [Candidatus Bathyarchaeota archaeon BA1]|nr:MAG: hypothetical protein AOA65_0044 [Candidatus Bathyarchaeota archaeon BA1]